MIDFLEIRDHNRVLIGVIDNATSIIWHPLYYGTGDFEIYVSCTPDTAAILKVGNYVTRIDERNVGIIERVQITYTVSDGRMIVASGRFAKSILDRRIIYTLDGNSVSPKIVSGNVETAARTLVSENAISCSFDAARNMPMLALGASAGITKTVIDADGGNSEKQVTYKELLSYTESLLQEYGIGSTVTLDPDTLKLMYSVYEGRDRSVDNTEGNDPIIFSQDFDNIVSSDYQKDTTTEKNTAIVGGEGEGTARFVSVYKTGASGMDRRELFVDASSITRNYKDADGNDKTLTDSEYNAQLIASGKQNAALHEITETFNGDIDLSNGIWQYGIDKDYYLGDILSVQDVGIGLYINARLIGIMETQDESGYKLAGEFGV